MTTKVVLHLIKFEARRERGKYKEIHYTEIDRTEDYIIPATEEDLEMLDDVNLKTPDFDELPVRRLLHLLGKSFLYEDEEEYEERKKSGKYLIDGELEEMTFERYGEWEKYLIEDNGCAEADRFFHFVFD